MSSKMEKTKQMAIIWGRKKEGRKKRGKERRDCLHLHNLFNLFT